MQLYKKVIYYTMLEFVKTGKRSKINSSIKVFHVKLKIKKIDGHLKPQE